MLPESPCLGMPTTAAILTSRVFFLTAAHSLSLLPRFPITHRSNPHPLHTMRDWGPQCTRGSCSMTHMPPDQQRQLSPPSMRLLNEMRSEDLGCFKISPTPTPALGLKSSASLRQAAGDQGMPHPVNPFSSSSVLVLGNEEHIGRKRRSVSGQRCQSVPSLAPVTLLWPM